MTENLFSLYSFHMQQLEDIVDQIAAGSSMVKLLENTSEDDIMYIKNRIKEKYDITINIR